MADHAARVRKGAALLDERVPGWADRIDRMRLAVSDGNACVLAQVVGKHYAYGLRLVSLSPKDGPMYGFASDGETSEQTNEDFRLLTECWHAEITARTTAQTPA